MEKRAEIILKGRVQKAGFRDYIDEVAFDLDIKGWVKNLEDNTVKIVCEGKSESLDEFITRIQIKEYPIRVEEAVVEYSSPSGEFNDFSIIREEDIVQATYERMDAAGRYMREMNHNLGGKFDKMLDKQDLHIKITRSGFEDLKNEIHMQRDDFKEVFIKEVDRLHSEINEIKATLARMQAA